MHLGRTVPRIFQFLMGSGKIPAAGLHTDLKIYFTSQEDRLPWVSTCDLSINFPRSMSYLSEEEFKAKLDFCILGSVGYGKVWYVNTFTFY